MNIVGHGLAVEIKRPWMGPDRLCMGLDRPWSNLIASDWALIGLGRALTPVMGLAMGRIRHLGVI